MWAHEHKFDQRGLYYENATKSHVMVHMFGMPPYDSHKEICYTPK